MKRASYREAVRWIADNDEDGGSAEVQDVAIYVTVMLIADIFGVDNTKVAADVLRERAKRERENR